MTNEVTAKQRVSGATKNFWLGTLAKMTSFYSGGGGVDPQSAFADALARARQVSRIYRHKNWGNPPCNLFTFYQNLAA